MLSSKLRKIVIPDHLEWKEPAITTATITPPQMQISIITTTTAAATCKAMEISPKIILLLEDLEPETTEGTEVETEITIQISMETKTSTKTSTQTLTITVTQHLTLTIVVMVPTTKVSHLTIISATTRVMVLPFLKISPTQIKILTKIIITIKIIIVTTKILTTQAKITTKIITTTTIKIITNSQPKHLDEEYLNPTNPLIIMEFLLAALANQEKKFFQPLLYT
jgi:hypothetical protein